MSVILYKNCDPVTDIYKETRSRINSNLSNTFILIVPTRRKIRELQRDLLKSTNKYTTEAFHIFTLETFAIQLHNIFFKTKILLNTTSQAVLFEQAIKNCSDKLNYFLKPDRRQSIPRGTFEKIVNVINELKKTGVYVSLLQIELETAIASEKNKLQDIILIYEEYEKLLGQYFIDTGGIYKDINDNFNQKLFEEKFYKHFPFVNTIFVAGFDKFADPEITMLDAVSKFSNNNNKIGMVITFDYFLNNDSLFAHLKQNYDKFIQLDFKTLIKREKEIENFRHFVVENLFKEKPNKTDYFRDKILFINAKNREDEVETIARIIRYSVLKNSNQDISKICVSMYKPQLYTKLFHEIFSRYGIPVNITDRFSLDQSPVVVSLLSILGVVIDDYRRRDILRAISSPYFSFEYENEKIDAGNLIALSTTLKINSGRNLWLKKLERRIQQIEAELKESDDDVMIKNLNREKKILLKAHRDFNYLEKILSVFNSSMTPNIFKNNILALIERLKVEENILKLNYEDPELLEKDTRAFQKFLSILDDLIDLISFQQKSDTEQQLKFYFEKLKVAVSQTRYNIRQKYGYGVYVTSFEETRGLEFDTMFVIGLVDGEFPPAYIPEIFYSKNRQNEKELYHLTENRYLFYQCITNFKEKLYISYPQRDGDVELVKSPFYDSFLQIIDAQSYGEKLQPELSEYIFTEEELMQKVGYNLGLNFNVELSDIESIRFQENLNFIKSAIAIENSRYTEQYFEYNGNIYSCLSEKGKENLTKKSNAVYSITQLENYAKCPFRYFIEYMLQITKIPELEEGLTALEKGSILHEILFEFYKARRDNQEPVLSQCSEEEYQKALSEIFEIAQRKLSAIPQDDVLSFMEKELILGTKERSGIIKSFLENERNRKLEVIPKYFEASFGGAVGGSKRGDNKFQIKEPIDIDGYKLRGKVDRIDVGNNCFTIVDYKTGRSDSSFIDVMNGLILQLPVYIYAVEKLLIQLEGRHLTPAAATYYKLDRNVDEKILLANEDFKDKGFILLRKSKNIFANDSELKELIVKSIGFVKKYITQISEGKFPLNSDDKIDKICRSCNYDKICRKQLTLEKV